MAQIPASLQQTRSLEFLGDLVDRGLDILGLPRTRADELAATEEQHDDLRAVEPVDESGELLRFVLDLLEAEADRNRVEVDMCAEVARRNDVLNLYLRFPLDHNTRCFDLFGNFAYRGLDLLEALRTRANNLAAPEKQCRGLWF